MKPVYCLFKKTYIQVLWMFLLHLNYPEKSATVNYYQIINGT